MYDVAAREPRRAAALVRAFAAFPGVRGCYARMFTGKDCADDGAAAAARGRADAAAADAADAADAAAADAAAAALRSHFVFVGLGAEHWTASVCLWHQASARGAWLPPAYLSFEEYAAHRRMIHRSRARARARSLSSRRVPSARSAPDVRRPPRRERRAHARARGRRARGRARARPARVGRGRACASPRPRARRARPGGRARVRRRARALRRAGARDA